MDVIKTLRENPALASFLVLLVVGILVGVGIVISADVFIYAAGLFFIVAAFFILSSLTNKYYRKVTNVFIVQNKIFELADDVYVDSLGNIYKGQLNDILLNPQKHIINLNYNDLPTLLIRFPGNRLGEYKLMQRVEGGYLPFSPVEPTNASLLIEKINEAYISNLSKIDNLTNELNNKLFTQQNLGYFLILTVGSIVLLISSTYMNNQTTNQLNSLIQQQVTVLNLVKEYICLEKNNSFSFCERENRNETAQRPSTPFINIVPQ